MKTTTIRRVGFFEMRYGHVTSGMFMVKNLVDHIPAMATYYGDYPHGDSY